MAVYRAIVRKSTLKHKVEVTCRILVPDLSVDPTQALACGEDTYERNENLERFAEEFMEPQYFGAMRRNIEAYENSLLPTRLLYKQPVEIGPIAINIPAAYGHGVIFMENDAVCGIGRSTGEFLFGHEMGHKAMDVKEEEMLIREIAGILAIGYDFNEERLKELAADEFGNMIDTRRVIDRCIFHYPVDEGRRKEIQRRILKFAWN